MLSRPKRCDAYIFSICLYVLCKIQFTSYSHLGLCSESSRQSFNLISVIMNASQNFNSPLASVGRAAPAPKLTGLESLAVRKLKSCSQQPQRKRFAALENFHDRWSWEILGAIVSILAIIVIVVILQLYDGRPLEDWSFSITLNSLVSLFAAVAKSAMLIPVGEALGQLKWLWFSRQAHTLQDFQAFDDASRGPWGAFQLILSTRAKAKLALWGALITLIALAMDPFTQQVVVYESRVTTSGNATMSRA